MPEDGKEEAAELTQKSMKGYVYHETKRKRKNGSVIPVSMSAAPIYINNQFEGCVVSYRDITERKQMEMKLQHTTKRLETLLETAREGIVAVDPQENITFVNRAFAEILNYEEIELLGLNTRALLDEDGWRKIAEETVLRKKGLTSRYELTMYRKNGEPRTTQLSAAPLWNEDGSYAGSLGIVMDITERKQMQQKLQEYSQQLEVLVEKRTQQLREAQEQLIKSERLAAIGQAAAMVGHDLRNPLTGIKGAAYYLKTKLSSTLDNKANEMIELIEKDIEYSNKIITDLLEYSREIKL